MKINTTTLLLIGVALVGVYIITRPKTVVPTMPVYNPGYAPPYYGNTSGSTTAQDISAGGTAASSILDSISNLFG